MPHDHHHHHELDLAGDRRVAGAVAVNVLLTVVQIVAGLFSGSLALIADGVHNLSDAVSLVIAFAARRIARRPADSDMTFGYGRAEVVAALVNYVTLIVIALWLAAEGVGRFFNPVTIEGWTVVIVAGVALFVDLFTAGLIMRLSRDSMNIRAAFLHNVADAMGSVAVIVGGALILLFGWWVVDPIITLMISGYILWHSWRGLGPVIRVLMLASPDSPGVEEVARAMCEIDGVADVHALHLWRLQEHRVALQAHVVIEDTGNLDALRAELKAVLAQRFGITHAALELETAAAVCHDTDLIGQG
ncbi:cation diffusion facilitator family transporter [Lutimaribacter sp. EGI FJ00015]|uniref:Cation diffusion facilitator family transporter n=1 Tax=Lutimaribacter degradans TaxID=2945989 RepID=A0ACC5ZYH8_9RHOB|nr:cation diffusion facilitator family transporter [Lutimaribacter sp. EGI FJ00013]MCM2562599.1 cation diffusion facilitator family transporter [Lutimaribacter sp. EGI FJ00013]MCO0613756.1 cation diffusion facilitator family transporter [Lutimaribacter sp. EGI FJ00015]MCO0636761.1 cation diffusion facilitator family transporter [Lutimaribacter sp. EGI FJ00014]